MASILKLYIYNYQVMVMKVIKRISSLILMLILMASFSQCSSAQKLQKKAPADFGDVHYLTWTAGVKGGGSGINIYIPVSNTSIVLDSVYFRGKAVKLELVPGNKQEYLGLFRTESNQPKDIILSSDPKEEHANTMPIHTMKIPFELKDDECVVSYIKDNKTQYYKISNIRQEASINLPSAPPNKQ